MTTKESDLRQRRLAQLDRDLDDNVPTPLAITAEPRPEDNHGAQEVAVGIIRLLDARYSRERVHAVAVWVRYLSTQS